MSKPSGRGEDRGLSHVSTWVRLLVEIAVSAAAMTAIVAVEAAAGAGLHYLAVESGNRLLGYFVGALEVVVLLADGTCVVVMLVNSVVTFIEEMH
jgi:hypothetical protein